MPIDIINESTKNAMGGTELQAYELQRRLSPELLENIQIIPSRVRELDFSKKRVLWNHDLAGDPEAEHLANGGYNKFDKIVFVSNWQMQSFINKYSIPWYKCAVVQNAINPLELSKPWVQGEKLKLIYHTTPHRGLNILLSAFDKLCEIHEDIELDVYSSFKIYGWEERDAQFQSLFDFCKDHPNINYHGSVPNEDIRTALSSSHIFAYPSVWQETSCIALIEAMSAGLLCVHPNYAALPETAANWTWQYQYQDSIRDHTNHFFQSLNQAITLYKSGAIANRLYNQASYTNMFYDWNNRQLEWEMILRSL